MHFCMSVCVKAREKSIRAAIASGVPQQQQQQRQHERRHRRHLPAGRRPQLLPVRQRPALIAAAARLCCRNLLHARAGSSASAEPAGSPLQRAAAHGQRRRTAPVLPLLGARRPAEVSGRDPELGLVFGGEGWWGGGASVFRGVKYVCV